jgi:hypothetical protein
MKCILHATRGTRLYLGGTAWDVASVQGVGVVCVVCVMGHDIFMLMQVAALPPCSPSLPAMCPLDGPQGEDRWWLQSCAVVICMGLR